MDLNMDTSDSEEERPGTPTELILAAGEASLEALPKKSKDRYMQVYNQFQKYKASKNATSNSERVLMAYFREMGKDKTPTTLWSRYSMLKATMKIYDNINIATYASLVGILKSKAAGYRPKKAKTFTEANIKTFIEVAPDVAWLDVKVALIFAICGCCRTHGLPDIKVQDIKDMDDMEDVFLIKIMDTKTVLLFWSK